MEFSVILSLRHFMSVSYEWTTFDSKLTSERLSWMRFGLWLTHKNRDIQQVKPYHILRNTFFRQNIFSLEFFIFSSKFYWNKNYVFVKKIVCRLVINFLKEKFGEKIKNSERKFFPHILLSEKLSAYESSESL